MDLSEVAPIEIRSPTLVADKDPYNSLKPKLKPEPTPQAPAETADNQKSEDASAAREVKTSNDADRSTSITQTQQPSSEIRKAIPVESIRKAIPVSPQEKKPVEIRRAIPVKPLDQENEGETLLRSAIRPPTLDQMREAGARAAESGNRPSLPQSTRTGEPSNLDE